MILIFLLPDPAFAAVSGNELPAAGKAVNGKQTVIGTALAAGHRGLIVQGIDLFDGKHGAGCFPVIIVPGDQGSAKGTHDTGDIRTDGLSTGNQFKAAQDSIIVEGSALNHDTLPKVFGIGQFNDLQQCILNDRIGKAGRYVGDVSPFLLGLLYLGIHKYGATGS